MNKEINDRVEWIILGYPWIILCLPIYLLTWAPACCGGPHGTSTGIKDRSTLCLQALSLVPSVDLVAAAQLLSSEEALSGGSPGSTHSLAPVEAGADRVSSSQDRDTCAMPHVDSAGRGNGTLWPIASPRMSLCLPQLPSFCSH